jgi:hypothetical protein
VKDGKPIQTSADWDRAAIVEKLNWLLKQSATQLAEWQWNQRTELAAKHSPEKALKVLLENL